MALDDYRQSQKKGRDDRGSGDAIVGRILKSARTEGGYTQESLGQAAGLHPTTIGKIESGQRGMSFTTFCRLAYTLRNQVFHESIFHHVSHPFDEPHS